MKSQSFKLDITEVTLFVMHLQEQELGWKNTFFFHFQEGKTGRYGEPAQPHKAVCLTAFLPARGNQPCLQEAVFYHPLHTCSHLT